MTPSPAPPQDLPKGTPHDHPVRPRTRHGHTNRGQNSIVKVVFASLVGTAVEWYDFFLYGSAAALVFGTLFFPESEPVTATLLAFGTYALGLRRPAARRRGVRSLR